MPDDNRFANIGIGDDETPSEESESDDSPEVTSDSAAADETSQSSTGADSTASEGTSGTVGTSGESGESDTTTKSSTAPTVDPAESGPAFEFDAVQQKAVYPRPESWDARTEALDFEVKRELREHGVKDVTGRELDDAIARTIPEVTDRIVEKVLEARRQKFDTE